MQLLGIDYGRKKIGLAKADTASQVALPLEVLENQGESKVLDELEQRCHSLGIEAIVIGLPKSLAGQYSSQTEETEAFTQHLERRTGLPVYRVDERLSTRQAANLLQQQGSGADEDAVAAMLILQSYLDQQE